MRLCENMYVFQGMQFCKYPDFKCEYQSEKYLMQAKFDGQEISSPITYCRLNNVDLSDLENMIKE